MVLSCHTSHFKPWVRRSKKPASLCHQHQIDLLSSIMHAEKISQLTPPPPHLDQKHEENIHRQVFRYSSYTRGRALSRQQEGGSEYSSPWQDSRWGTDPGHMQLEHLTNTERPRARELRPAAKPASRGQEEAGVGWGGRGEDGNGDLEGKGEEEGKIKERGHGQ